MNVLIMHVFYPGMTQSRPVFVGEPVKDSGYTGYVWTVDINDVNADPVRTHCSRLSEDPVGQLSVS
jgi:hypothetical protein